MLVLAGRSYALDPGRTIAQYVHDSWGAERGFPARSVYAICQSPDGYLWIGTELGLVRFDGFEFTLMQRPIPAMPSIGPVRGLVVDGEGNLWIRPDGPHLLRYRDGKFEDAFARFNLQETAFAAMSNDNQGGVLLATISNSLLRYRHGQFETVEYDVGGPGGVVALAETHDGKIWLGTADDGLYTMNEARIAKAVHEGPGGHINALFQAGNGDLLVATERGGLLRDGGRMAGLPAPLDTERILAILRDREGETWAGTSSGLVRVSATGEAAAEESKNGPESEVTAVYQDRDGDIWFGVSQGIERLRDGAFTTFAKATGLPAKGTGPVYADAQGRVWIAPLSGGVFWLKQGRVTRVHVAGLDHDVVYSISGGGGEVWLGRQHGGLTVLTANGDSFTARTYTARQGLAQNNIFAVHRNRDGTVWAGSVNAGVSRLKDGKFTNFATAGGVPFNAVNSIAEGEDGTTWFATPTGLSFYANGRWGNWTTQDGLPSSNVRTIFEDSKHMLWIATTGGLACLSADRAEVPEHLPGILREPIFAITEDGTGAMWFAGSGHVLKANREKLLAGTLEDGDFQVYGEGDGLRGVEEVRRDRTMVSDGDGRIWLAVSGGLAMADPRQILARAGPVKVRIESMLAGDVQMDRGGRPEIPAGRKTLRFNYAAESLSGLDRIRFRYRLDGVDQGWVETARQRQAVYRNLDPGAYSFHVMASSSEGLWNGPETTETFVMEREFWQTWWFRAALAAAALLAAMAAYQLRIYRLTRQLNVRFQERLMERARIAQELHDTLLQSFQGLILRFQAVHEMLPGRPGEAKEMLDGALERADEALLESRDAIQNIRSSSVPGNDLAETMNELTAEMREEMGKSEDATVASVLVEGNPRAVRPILRDEIYRIARESLRNAFRHAGASRIETEIAYGDDALRVRFRDDGTGIDPEVLTQGRRAGHWGLVGMHERARRVGGQLNVWSRPGAGTEIELKVPGNIAYSPGKARTRFRLWSRKEERNDDDGA